MHGVDIHLVLLQTNPLEVPFDGLRRPYGSLLERKTVFHPLDGTLDWGRDALDTPLRGGTEHADVALPTGSPFDGLPAETFLSTRRQQVERGKARHTSGAHAPNLSAGGGRNTDRHVDGSVKVELTLFL